MKPLNLDNRPCSPVSSNCIVWQGPDISCINICTGDTISDVVAALATELCTLLDQTNVNNYDLACLGAACGPKDFQALIQLLINKICELNGITPDTVKSTGGCPDCVVTVASCFVVGNQTTMQLLDYVNMIAEKVCALIDEINALQIQINNLDIRVTVLENTPPPVFTLPSILVDCTLTEGVIVGGSSYTIDLVLNALLNDNINGYCSLIDATGLPADLFSAVSSQCITSTTITLSNPPVPYGTEYLGTWVNSPTTAADAINNIWIVLCDYYDYLQSLAFIVEDTNTVNLNYAGGILQANVQDTDWVRLLGFSFIPNSNTQGVPMVRRIGNVLHFRGTIIVPLISGGGALTWNYSPGVDSYFLETTVLPFSGAGGVTINSSGNILFNNGNSVIPLSVLPAGYAIDQRYQNPAGWKLAYRAIPIDDNNSTVLTTYFSQVITDTGALGLGLIKDLESSTISGAGGAGSWDTSHLNSVISHVTSGQFVPDYNNSGTTIYDNTVGGSQPSSIYFTDTLIPLVSYTYPFSCNANDQNQIGGFFQRLDGLTAFISKCGTLIATPPPC